MREITQASKLAKMVMYGLYSLSEATSACIGKDE